MKGRIELAMTPEEARAAKGLADLRAPVEMAVAQMQKRFAAASDGAIPRP